MNKKKREHILEEAEKLFNRFGIKKTAVDEIAKYARVAKGTIYNYFGDKEGLLKEILDKKIAFFETAVDKALRSIRDPFERLRVTLLERLKVTMNTPFISEDILKENAEENIRMMNERLDESALKAIDAIMKEGHNPLPEKDKNRMLNLINYTLRGMDESIRTHVKEARQENLEKDIEYLVKIAFSMGKNSQGGSDVSL